MENNNWRPAAAQGAEPSLETGGDWRTRLPPDSRQRIVNKIMETLKKSLPFYGQDGLEELKNIAMRFEEKIYSASVSQSDYLRRISVKMITMESKSQNNIPNSLPSNNKSPDSGASHNMQPQVHYQGQPLPMAMSANQSQARQQMLSQNIPNNMGPTGVQSSGSLTSALPPVSGLSQNSIPNAVGQNNTGQNISGVPQSSAGNSMGQGVPSNMFANSQRQMPGRQQVVPQQQQQPPQNTQQYLYQQQLLKQKLHQQGNVQHTLVQSHMQQQQQQLQQQQQQHLLQPTSQQSSMQTSSVMQPSMLQSVNLGLQQNQPSSTQQSTQSMVQHQQSILRQQQHATSIHQQQAPMMQQSLLPTQQQQLMAQQPNATNMQQNQLIAQQNSVGDMQQHQQQRLLGQQNNLQSLQQQQLLAQQNNVSNMHQQQLGSQGNVPGLQQQQQMLVTQPGNSTMQSNQQSLHMLQHPKVSLQQQTQQNATNMLPTQGQQSQQQLISQMQSQSTHLQQQLGLQQQQPNQIQGDMQPGLKASAQAPGSLLQQQNVIDQQNQLYQSQRPIPEASSTSLDSTAQTGNSSGGDWQEEAHQKIKTMKEMYLPELNEMYEKIVSKLQLLDSLSQQPKPDQLEKLKMFKSMLEKMITFLQFPKNNIPPEFKGKLGYYEKQIINFLNTNKGRKPIPPLQQGQLGQPHMQQPQSQVSQVQSHENQMNPQIQPINMQGSVPNVQQNNMTGMQHTSMSSLSAVSTSQQNMINSLQPASSLDSSQGNAMGSLQQTAIGPLQQNSVIAPQQANLTNFSSQNGVNMLQPTIPLQSNPNMLQHQHLKQQQEQMLHSQQLKQRQLQQMLHQQQQLHQQAKQHLPAQMQAHQMSQVHQMNDVNELKMRQGMGVKPGVFQQHISGGQRTAFTHQQMKSGSSFSISSPQLLQAASPQLSQHSSPQVDQQNLVSSLTKSRTPLQSANSPSIVPSPSAQLTPSPMPADSEKPVSGLSSLSNATGNVGQATLTQPPAPSLAIGTPGISASPLLAEFTVSDDGVHGNAMGNIASVKSIVTEQPIERLIRAVKSISSQAMSAAVSDIGHVVGMIDRIAGSAPGNGSRAAVGEDLVAMTNCRLQARNFITQDGMTGTRKMKRYISAMPLNVASSTGSVSDSYKFSGPDISDSESTATSSFKRPRNEAYHALLEEIREINLRLIDTVVDICEGDADLTAVAAAAEGGEGTIVKCSYIAVALSPNLKSQYASAQMSPIQPLRLLVPKNYPSCSPVLLDKLSVEISNECEDLSIKAKSRFGISLRTLSQPMSLGEMARTWDACARAVITEYAQRSGGGTFSSRYGTWENCLSAA